MNAAISRLDQCDRPGLGRRAGPGQRQDPRPDRGRHLLPRRAPRAGPATRQHPRRRSGDSHRSTVGRDTPANAAISSFGRPSARHNTIRARVATAADTSALFTSADSSARCSDVNSTAQPTPRSIKPA